MSEWDAKLGNVTPQPVLGPGDLQKLVSQPLSAASRHLHTNPNRPMRPLAPTFIPFGPNERPGPGMLFGLDAEFVALSPPDKIVRGYVNIYLLFTDYGKDEDAYFLIVGAIRLFSRAK